MRQLCGLGKRHINHHQQIQGLKGLLYALAVGAGVHRITAIDPHCAKAIGVIAQHSVRENIGR